MSGLAAYGGVHVLLRRHDSEGGNEENVFEFECDASEGRERVTSTCGSGSVVVPELRVLTVLYIAAAGRYWLAICAEKWRMT